MERDAELFERGAELGDVVAVHEVVGLLVEKVDSGAGQHDVEGGFARDDAERDTHGLVRAMGDTGIFGDQDEGGLPGGHAS